MSVKKFSWLLLAILLFSTEIHDLSGGEAADEKRDLPPPISIETTHHHARQRWEMLGWGIWFGFPRSVRNNVEGVKLGLPISSGRSVVHGVELAIFYAATDEIFGLQLAPVNVTKRINGLQMSLVNVAEERSSVFQLGITNVGVAGIQFGLVNVAENSDFQFGLLNFNSEGWLPFFPFFNF
ncbi:MAG: hypothetical protein PHV75_01380 [Victivallaceae bacterium]|jgi:hypothetical protein|nr:hypothetical protein [Victivallaceae bacterium]NLK83725.1 hypothetical protein [Lentisphaerota bacterium]MDD3117363.1 hypothetical protein [Victivallaceae bacterium]MDD3703530.1 hypothetical protein [Victivallaceae bacterium]MDD4317147.1 hypothetical protein [Victivallaceae bacterium]